MYNFNNISAAFSHRLLNFVVNESLDIGLSFHGQNASYHICIICIFMNIDKNAKKGEIIKSIDRLISSRYCHCCMF